MRAVKCDRCAAFVTSWKAVQLYNKTDNTYLFAQDKKAKWIRRRSFIDLCGDCYKNMEIAIADNIGQVLMDELTGSS